MVGYRFIGGFVLFIVLVLAVLNAAGDVYPEVRGTNPGVWPPVFPSFSLPTWASGTAPGCDIATLCINVLVFWFALFVGIIVGGVVFITASLVAVVGLLVGLVSFRVPALPSGLEWINLALSAGIIVVMALFIFRLIRSIIPFVSGE